MSSLFSRLAHLAAEQCGRSYVFAFALLIILVWAASGPIFAYSDTWQLIINAGTTIVTFLMVFLLQNTQNRDTAAIQLKLDELIRANEHARNKMLVLEDLTEDELKRIKQAFAAMAGPTGEALKDVQEARRHIEQSQEALSEIASQKAKPTA